MTLPAAGEPISFAQHVQPLFRESDRRSMKFAFDLWSYDDVVTHADGIAARLHDGSMPCDGQWSDEQIAAFDRWIGEGHPA